MRILLLNQFFWPDSAPTSQLLTDLARELADRGHEVTAVCGSSSYAGEMSNAELPGIEVRRMRVFELLRGGIGRLICYLSFLISGLWAGLSGKRPDLVLTLTTPPLLSLVGTIMKILRGCSHWIWEMDVYPDVAVELGWIAQGGMVDRLIGNLADWSRGSSDGVIVLGECMKQRLLDRGIPLGKLRIADNWADGSKIRPASFPGEPLLKILYSGNLGLAHDVDTICETMLELNPDPPAHFVFSGGGARRAALEAWCREHSIENVSFQSYSTLEGLGDSLAGSDIGLVTQRAECLGSVVPSKIYALMAAGRPILFIGPKGSTPHRIIEQFRCGWQIDCGDSHALAQLLYTLQYNRCLIHEAGKLARRAFVENYDLPIGVNRIADALDARMDQTREPSVASAA